MMYTTHNHVYHHKWHFIFNSATDVDIYFSHNEAKVPLLRTQPTQKEALQKNEQTKEQTNRQPIKYIISAESRQENIPDVTYGD